MDEKKRHKQQRHNRACAVCKKAITKQYETAEENVLAQLIPIHLPPLPGKDFKVLKEDIVPK